MILMHIDIPKYALSEPLECKFLAGNYIRMVEHHREELINEFVESGTTSLNSNFIANEVDSLG